MPVTHGLTLGKFAPLHHGHQLVIETALREMDRLSILIYDAPETTSIPLSIRAAWLRELYPAATVLEAWDGPTAVGDSPEIKHQHEQYILKKLGPEKITHFYSSEFYGEHVSRALAAVNRQVDPERATIPISGSDIRLDPFISRQFLHPRVYRDLITNIVFLGAPSTGKSTLAKRLADEFNTTWMPEYGRDYWEKHQVNRRLTPNQLFEIAQGHLEREETLLYQANRILFTDTNAITTCMFAQAYHGTAQPQLVDLARQASTRYDLFFLCDVDIPYDDTWDRSGDVDRLVFQKQIYADLLQRKIPFITLRGSLDERVKTVEKILAKFQKYSSLADTFMF
jgi:NadR type nicotinamide-nucleotide adenylyltransferase